ncbi:FAD-dependent oxidoreductase [Lujinxingia litoralis]|uniref:FAD-dependent oxidoreductase n=1 Tax=Lujinxingia litoralis TaxID=2211119 RepID=A0A328CAN6_9DELT|nr:FAD-binding protein [Lujinxingia litoralis]RAL25202.1 FAD-dependent oxidoreductase [Lujinxingia litoralis]
MNESKFKRLHVGDLRVDFQADGSELLAQAAKKLGVSPEAIAEVEVLKQSLDARGRPRYVYNVEVALAEGKALKRLPAGIKEAPAPGSLAPRRFQPRKKERVIVIGAGPAGLFCAHRLADSGVDTILLDRGQPVEVRGRDVSKLMHRGELKEDSNICFGEGGAGTWSDGKLYTRVNDVRVRHVLETIVALGGPEEILIKGKPHLGTDRLVALCKSFRAHLLEEGCQVRFGAFVRELIVRDEGGERVVKGVVLRDGERIEADRVVLAVGHSAREMYRHLAEQKVSMAPKPFAVGFRVEHRQELINQIQYGKYADHPDLPAADYRLAENLGKGEQRRGIYSFCMCPGGQVVPSHTLPDGICVNGMSHASRKGHWANSALVVSVRPEDFGAFGPVPELDDYDGLLAGMAFQHEAERRAYQLGGGGFVAPAQRVSDFKAGQASTTVRKTTYKTGIAAADLAGCYPDFVIESLRVALDGFERRMRGFVNEDALLIGVETRTSAPVQIDRDPVTYQSSSVARLYPCGEGSGYGGGIVSAAIDGLRVAETILETLSV